MPLAAFYPLPKCCPSAAQLFADWRIVVTAPLRLVNQLPVAGSLLVWEAAAGPGRELAGRQTVQVESGATVPIHSGERQGGLPHAAAAGAAAPGLVLVCSAGVSLA